MAQYDFGTIDPNTKSGTALASDLNSWRTAVHSTHSGSSAPSYTTAAMLWADTTTANYELKMYDGAQWITVGIIDATNNVARVAVDPAETSYITSTTSGQIKHVIANVDTMTVRSSGLQFNVNFAAIIDQNNAALLQFQGAASAVNFLRLGNAATGGDAQISAQGSDANIGLRVLPKGDDFVHVIADTTTLTNTFAEVLRLESQTTGTPAVGIGTAIGFRTETAAGNVELGSRIISQFNDVTAGAENARLLFQTMTGGAAPTNAMIVDNSLVTIAGGLSFGGTTLTATAAELNILDGVTATAAELNILDGVTATTAELNFVDGVTSAIQTQLNARAPLASPALTGTPTAPTAAEGTNTTQIATTAFVQLRARYLSSGQTITSAGLVTLAHGLYRAPETIQCELVCITGEANWVTNDVVLAPLNSTTSTIRFNAVYFDATNIYIRYSDQTNCFVLANKTTGAAAALTNGNWRFRVRAYA